MKRVIPFYQWNYASQIFASEKVRVYFNLHKKCFSVKSKKTNRVLFHTNEIHLHDVTYKVSQSGRQRVLKEQRKNVHAYVDGKIGAIGSIHNNGYINVTYNPYKYDSFVNKDTEEKIVATKSAILLDKKIYAY